MVSVAKIGKKYKHGLQQETNIPRYIVSKIK